MKLKIAHFCIDNQFVESANYSFNKAFPGSLNHFYVFRGIFNRRKTNLSNDFIYKKMNYHRVHFFKKSFANKYDLIVFHSLNYWNSIILNKLCKDVKVLSIIWGGEVYTNSEIKTNFSRKDKFLNSDSFFKKVYSLIEYSFIENYKSRCNVIKKAILNSNYIACNKKEFYYLKKNKVFNENSTYVNFTYNPIEYMLLKYPKTIKKNKKIIIGKSGNVAENHLQIIKIIKENVKSFKEYFIHLPLAYGDNNYINLVKREIQNQEEINFKLDLNFEPMKEYYHRISDAELFVFNSLRQQGIGNILAHFYFGTKIFLNKTNLLYSFYKDLGFIFYNIQEFQDQCKNKTLSELSERDKNHNKKLINKYFSLHTNIIALKKLL